MGDDHRFLCSHNNSNPHTTKQLYTREYNERYAKQRCKKYREFCVERAPKLHLPDEYRVTEKNPNPATLDYGLPVDTERIYSFVMENELYTKPAPTNSDELTMVDLNDVGHRLTLSFGRDIVVSAPYWDTHDETHILTLYTNYSMCNYRRTYWALSDEDAIGHLRYLFRLSKKVIPKWYFDIRDRYTPPGEFEFEFEFDPEEEEEEFDDDDDKKNEEDE